MELLRLLSLIYVGVLVTALAASLIAIWVLLRRVAHALGGARDALTTTRRETAPLEESLRTLRDLFQEAAGEMQAADSALQETDTLLAERLGVGTAVH